MLYSVHVIHYTLYSVDFEELGTRALQGRRINSMMTITMATMMTMIITMMVKLVMAENLGDVYEIED